MLKNVKQILEKKKLNKLFQPSSWHVAMENGFETFYVVVKNLNSGEDKTVVLYPDENEITGLDHYIKEN